MILLLFVQRLSVYQVPKRGSIITLSHLTDNRILFAEDWWMIKILFLFCHESYVHIIYFPFLYLKFSLSIVSEILNLILHILINYIFYSKNLYFSSRNFQNFDYSLLKEILLSSAFGQFFFLSFYKNISLDYCY